MINGPDDYSEDSFWKKLLKYAKIAGKEVVEKALWLYYAAQKEETPAWAKAVIYAALAYFILPVDAIPDTIPVAGYSDDLGVLTTAIAVVALFIDKEVKQMASQRLRDWFGDNDDDNDVDDNGDDDNDDNNDATQPDV